MVHVIIGRNYLRPARPATGRYDLAATRTPDGRTSAVVRAARGRFAVAFVAALMVVAVACGGGSSQASGQTPGAETAAAPAPAGSGKSAPAATGAGPTSDTSSAVDTSISTTTTAGTVSESDNDYPELVNTPGPVAALAPDFTLPSIEGPEYTLSTFRGENPVLVVFYRAYW